MLLMSLSTMPDLHNDPAASGAPLSPQLATHDGTTVSFDERFRKARIRASMFGAANPEVRLGRYRVERRLGGGAMGSVYLAVDESLERNVAIKVLRREDDLHRARMQREAKALAKLSHPNVVTVHEVAEQDGELFVAMEYVPGQTLTEWLAEPRKLLDILWTFGQAARGLEAAHDAGVVHRDFKPDNVVVGEDGRVRVLDFGLAYTPSAPLLEEVVDPEKLTEPTRPTLTRTGLLAGTPAYMSPEQFLGDRVDARADQFSFCVALHEAVWGERPYTGDTVAELARVVLNGEPELSIAASGGTSAQVQRVRAAIRRGLARDAKQRFASMGQLIAALSTDERPRQLWKIAVLIAVLIALGTVGVGALAALVVLRPGPQSTNPATGSAAAASTLQCQLGTYEDGDRCLPTPWSPKLVQCTEAECRIPRWVVHRLVRGRDFEVGQGRLVDAKADGQRTGYKVFGVRSDNLAAVLGLNNGDVLRAIDDIAASDAERASSFSGKLEALVDGVGETRSVLHFERGGEPFSKTIVVFD